MAKKLETKELVKTFAADSLFSSLLFIFIFGLAIFISELISMYMDYKGTVGYTVYVPMIIKLIMLTIDGILFAAFLYAQAFSLLKELRFVCKDFQ